MRSALGIGLLWAAYTLGLYGVCLLKGYDVGFGQVISPSAKWVGGGVAPKSGTAYTWPPGQASNTVVIPSGRTGVATPPGSKAVG